MKVRRKDRLFRKLRASVPAVEKTLLDVNTKSAGEMVAIAKRLAPKDDGDLQAAIYFEPVKTAGSPAVKVAVDEGGGPTGKNAFYGVFVEFGTKAAQIGQSIASRGRSRKSARNHPGTPAQPFFFVAYRLIRKRHLGRVSRAVNKLFKKIAAKP